MSAAITTRSMLLASALALLVCSTCKKREEQAAYPQPVVTQMVPVPPPPGAMPPGPVPASPPMPAALGFFCGSDNDPQCPFARCLGGRCGGCTNGSECKPGAVCSATWFGQACLPAAQGQPAPQAPAPSPAPSVVTPAPAPPSANSDPTARARELCVARINEYRGRVGVGPIARRADRESCTDAQARSDGATGSIHGAFGQCGERSQNECPGWNGSLESITDRCLAMMFAEGPGQGAAHGHYNNMTDARATAVACGIATAPDGKIWMIQNFYR
jgi:hypothetical protein